MNLNIEKYYKNIKEYFTNKNIKNFFYVIFFILFFYTSFSIILKYLHFDVHAFDVGMEGGVAKNAFFNKSFYDEVLKRNYLADHFSPILIVVGSLFLIWKNVLVLLLFQNICIFLTAYIGFKIGKKILNNNLYSLFLTVLFIINPYTTNINLFEYHVETIAMPMYMYMLYVLVSDKKTKMKSILYVLFGSMGFLIKEDVIIAMGTIGLWTIFFKKNMKKEGLFVFIFNIITFFLVIKIFLPYFSNNNITHFFRYSHLGNSITDIFKNILIHPINFFISIFSPIIKLKYLKELFESFIYLPILSPVELLLSIPTIIFHLLSSWKPQYEFCCQYTVSIVPFLYFSAIYGFKYFINNMLKNNKIHIIIKIIFIIIMLNLTKKDFYNFRIKYNNYFSLNISQYKELSKKIKPLIPQNMRIYTGENLYPYFLEYNTGCILTTGGGLSKNVFQIPLDADYIIFAKKLKYNWTYNSVSYNNFMKKLKNNFKVIYESESFIMLKNKKLARKEPNIF